MILGISIATFTTIHVMLSLIGIGAGFVVLIGMIQGKHLGMWAAIFLAFTIMTSVTGFPIPPLGLDPPRVVGILSLLLLMMACAALYVFSLSGPWRWIYVVTATAALYFNCFVGVIQAFQKISFVNALAPTQSESPFAIAQVAVLIVFVALGAIAVKNFYPRQRQSAFSAR